MGDLEKTLKEYTEKIGINPVNKTEEEVWNKFLDESLPAPAIIGTENKVVDNRLVEGEKVICIIGRDFSMIEKVKNIWDHGNLSKESNDLLLKHGFTFKDLKFLDKSIEESILTLHNSFSLNNIENNFTKESSEEYEEFKKRMRVLGKELISKFLNE